VLSGTGDSRTNPRFSLPSGGPNDTINPKDLTNLGRHLARYSHRGRTTSTTRPKLPPFVPTREHDLGSSKPPQKEIVAPKLLPVFPYSSSCLAKPDPWPRSSLPKTWTRPFRSAKTAGPTREREREYHFRTGKLGGGGPLGRGDPTTGV
jgi:hypothetical protein